MKGSADLSFVKTIHYLFFLIAAISFSFFSISVLNDYFVGGEPYKQGDWLINSENGPVRRALTGDLFIWISDATGLNLLLVVALAQILVAFFLYFLVAILVAGDGTGALVLLALSSAFFIFFWTGDPQGAARKELITFTSMSAMAIAVNRRNSFLLILGAIIFPISVLAHEAMVLFLPVLALVYALSFKEMRDWRAFHIAFALVVALSLVAFVLALINNDTPDFTMVCSPLVERGLSPELCTGAIRWLEGGVTDGVQSVFDRIGLRMVTDLSIGYAVALLPALYVALSSNDIRLALIVTILPGIFFAPLFTFAVDYGRWISFHIFSIFFIFSILLRSHRLSIKRPLSPYAFLIFGIIGALLSHYHTRGLYWGGSVRRMASEFLNF